ncbi:MAG TPA: RrF2 family transcriptional regulator [Candidatus Hungatella pullicola]|nr:RrF2 family transcriptional regulator [Candidatus Hungatella pullicola]
MIISTKGRYALRVMIDLVQNQSDGYLPLKEIAARQEISEKYLESILKVLVQNHLLTGLRGKGGGYRLTRLPSEYTVGDILRLTEDTLAPVACLEPCAPLCPRSSYCPTLPMWKELDQMINRFFDGITIADLAEQNQEIHWPAILFRDKNQRQS